MSGGVNGIGGIGANAGALRDIMALRQQIIDRSSLLQQVHGAPAAAQPNAGFAGALQSALGAVESSQADAENQSAAYEKGETTDIAKVMLARQQASVGFEATLQVRNKLLSAYQDIMKLGV